MNAVFYLCGCRVAFVGDEPPPYCARHKDSVERVQMDKVEEIVEEAPPEELKMKPKTRVSKR